MGTNKYGARKTHSELCGRTFDSKAECVRGEELVLLEKAGEISDLEYQVPFVLSQKPSIKIKIDFKYRENGNVIHEDVKGIMMRDFRVKLAWLQEKFGISVVLSK